MISSHKFYTDLIDKTHQKVLKLLELTAREGKILSKRELADIFMKAKIEVMGMRDVPTKPHWDLHA